MKSIALTMVLLAIVCTTTLSQDVVFESSFNSEWKNSKLSIELNHMYDLHENGNSSELATYLQSFPANKFLKNQTSFLVDLTFNGTWSEIKPNLEKAGYINLSAFGALSNGYISIKDLRKLEKVPGLVFIKPILKPLTATGSVTSQADSSMNTDGARPLYSIDGSGVTLGIMSDSYDATNSGEDAGQASGDLPPDDENKVVVLLDFTGANASDEGRAIAELIYDIAPGAQMYFSSAFFGEASFAQGIQDLSDIGSDIIVDDVSYAGEPVFADGPIALAITNAAAAGITYFTSAGNAADDAWEEDWDDSGLTFNIGGLPYDMHDFDPAPGNVDERLSITIPANEAMAINFQWSDQYLKTGCTGSNSDFDIFLVQGGSIIAQSIDNNIGGDPIEFLYYDNTSSSDLTVDILIGIYSGSGSFRFKMLDFYKSITINEYDNQNATIVGHSNSDQAISVGAAFYNNTPEYGSDPAIIQSYSSYGGQEILYDHSCNSIPAELRNKPDVVGPDGVNTTFFGTDVGTDPDSYPNFFGTSASAPNVAAATALILELAERNGVNLTPISIQDGFASSSLDMESTGYDERSGNGFISFYDLADDLDALPVDFLAFKVFQVEDEAHLYWISSKEVNNSYFEIEASNNGIDFWTLGSVPGAINSQSLREYQFIDTKPSIGINYYRIKQVDLDGSKDYSEIRTLIFQSINQSNILQIYPNPVIDQFTVKLKELGSFEGIIEIRDLYGSIVNRLKIEDGSRIDVQNLASGVYLINLKDRHNSLLATSRMMKME